VYMDFKTFFITQQNILCLECRCGYLIILVICRDCSGLTIARNSCYAEFVRLCDGFIV